MKAYKTKSKGLVPAGTTCFPFRGHDYGVASDDSRITGREHRSFTLKMYGGHPSFTHPVDDLEEIEVEDIGPPDQAHVDSICKIGQGASCCRYLVMGAAGFGCEKLSALAMAIDCKKDMIARGDNCAGRAPR